MNTSHEKFKGGEREAMLKKIGIYLDEAHNECTTQDEFQVFKKRLGEYGRVYIRGSSYRPLTTSLLRAKDLLIVGGSESGWVFGRGRDEWSSSEISVTKRFVDRGGGLLVMGYGLGNAEKQSLLTAPYGITFTKDWVRNVTVSRDEISTHVITQGVDSFTLGSTREISGFYLNVEDPAILLATHEGHPVLACCESGKGRVVVVASVWLFAEKYIEETDNSTLMQNIMTYLLTLTPASESQREVTSTVPPKSVEPVVYEQEVVSPLLRTLSEAQAFRFFSDLGKNTGRTATSLAEFHDQTTQIPLESIEFHTCRGDFEAWIRYGLGDNSLADQIQHINPALRGEILRTTIQDLVKSHLDLLERVSRSEEPQPKPISKPPTAVQKSKRVRRTKKRRIRPQKQPKTRVPVPEVQPEMVKKSSPIPEPEVVVESPKVAPSRVEPVFMPTAREVWLHLFGDDDTRFQFDFATYQQQFIRGLPPISWGQESLDYVQRLRQPGDEPRRFDLPFTQTESWSPSNYLRRVLYHLTHGRISYYIDAKTKQQRGGSYGMAITPAIARMNQQRLETRHPITFSDESLLGEWPAAMITHLICGVGAIYLTTHRFLFLADQAWVPRDDSKEIPLPYLSFWSQVDFSTLLQALGVGGVPLLVETKKRDPLPKQLASSMWFTPVDAWGDERTLETITISKWEMDLIFVDGNPRGDGIHLPTNDQLWVFFGYRVTKTDRTTDFIAMIPRFVFPNRRNVKRGIQSDFQFFQSRMTPIDALDLIAFSRIARTNALLREVDQIRQSTPLPSAPPPI